MKFTSHVAGVGNFYLLQMWPYNEQMNMYFFLGHLSQVSRDYNKIRLKFKIKLVLFEQVSEEIAEISFVCLKYYLITYWYFCFDQIDQKL